MWAAPSGSSPDFKMGGRGGEAGKRKIIRLLPFGLPLGDACAATDSFAPLRSKISRLPSLTKDQVLFRTLPGLQQVRPAEVARPKHRADTCNQLALTDVATVGRSSC